MLEVCALSFDYSEQSILTEIQFSLNNGQLLHLHGGNGTGKTTLLRLLAGLLRPTKGMIYWRNQPIYDQLRVYQHQLCYVGHKMGISTQLTVAENCFFDTKKSNSPMALPALLDVFGLQALANIKCYQLSAGQKKRVGLMRLVISQAQLWLLDEPLTALDESSIALFSQCAKTHLNQNGLIIMTSHQPLPACFGTYQDYVL
jgi:heme exporter protein A